MPETATTMWAEQNREQIETIKRWADRYGFDYHESDGQYDWSDNKLAVYADNSEYAGFTVTEQHRGGELSVEINNPDRLFTVVKRDARSIFHSIDDSGELDKDKVTVSPVSRIKTRGQVGPYDRDENDVLVFGGFDYDASRGPDHDVIDVEFVIDPR